MPDRPKLKVPLNKWDKTVEYTGWIFLVLTWIFVVYSYIKLPQIIPHHFSASGEADSYGDKSIVFELPLISSLLFLLMTVLNKYPHIFNYPVNITAENALKQYTMASRMMRYLKLAVVLVFGIILVSMYQTGTGKAGSLQNWLLPLIIVIVMLPSVYFIAKSLKSNKKIR